MKKFLLTILLFSFGTIAYAAPGPELAKKCLANKTCMEVCEYAYAKDASYKMKVYYYHDPTSSKADHLFFHTNSSEGEPYFSDPMPRSYYVRSVKDYDENGKLKMAKIIDPYISVFQPSHWRRVDELGGNIKETLTAYEFFCPTQMYYSQFPVVPPKYGFCFANRFDFCDEIIVEVTTPEAKFQNVFYESTQYNLVSNRETLERRYVQESIDYFVEEAFNKVLSDPIQVSYADMSEEELTKVINKFYLDLTFDIVRARETALQNTELKYLNFDHYAFIHEWLRDEIGGAVNLQLIRDKFNDMIKTMQEEGVESGNLENAIYLAEILSENVNSLVGIVNEAFEIILKGATEYSQTCGSLFGSVENKGDPAYWIQLTLNVIRIAGIAALFLLSSMDFFKALVAQDNDAIKKASSTALKRFVYTIILFFLPILIKVLFTTIDWYGTIEQCSEIIS